MRSEVLYALLLFYFVSGITPGPNNMMLMSSGVNFGFRRTLPHLAGVVVGFSLMVGLIGIGLDAIFTRFPFLTTIMRYLGIGYMLWLAWRISRSGAVSEGEARGRPLGFFGAAAFQWVNPKAWAIAIGALTAYAVSANTTISVAAVALTYLAIGLPSSGAWVLFGSAMRTFLSHPGRARSFNWTMAALLVASIAPVLWE
jgi:threonine/homoserine/homoserine lactone efflux protein